jgi:hypothetical protein
LDFDNLNWRWVYQVALFSQRWQCAGCGMRVEQRYAASFRFCHYLGTISIKVLYDLVCVVLHRALLAHVSYFGVALFRCTQNLVSFLSQSCLLLATKLSFLAQKITSLFSLVLVPDTAGSTSFCRIQIRIGIGIQGLPIRIRTQI